MTNLEPVLRVLAVGTGLFTIAFSILGVIAARRFWKYGRTTKSAAATPPVTILKPIKGKDTELYENLASFLRQDYPRFQVLFALQSADDPALPVLKRLERDFPAVDLEIVISKNRIGYNPKINNLSNAYPFAKHDLLLISDSDIRVGPDFLRKAAAPLADPKVGMVTCYYRSGVLGGKDSQVGLGGLLESIAVNAQFLPQALVAGFGLGLKFAMGAAMLVRREAFEAAGGFPALSDHLADDFVLGSSILSAGYGLEFSGVPVDIMPEDMSLAQHLAHIARWARTIFLCQPSGYAGLILLQGFAFLSLHIALFGPRALTVSLWLAVAAVRMTAIAWMHRVYLANPAVLRQVPLIPFADLLQFGAWLSGFQSRTVQWRGEAYRIRFGGRLVPTNTKTDTKTSVAVATTAS